MKAIILPSYFNKCGRRFVQKSIKEFRNVLEKGPKFEEFVKPVSSRFTAQKTETHYLDDHQIDGQGRKIFFETFGCQMNVNDTELVRGIMFSKNYTEALSVNEADVYLIMTCSIREKAEHKIWERIRFLKKEKRLRNSSRPLSVAILGCMAERMKQSLLEKACGSVDVIAGPDSYRDLPRLLAHHLLTDEQALNVILSWEETYADIMPIRTNSKVNAYLSIMRGCDNMCTYCIVPYTRGRERSRPIQSIVDEVRKLSEQGVKQVTLLGQNVNSYRDMSDNIYSQSNFTSSQRQEFKTVYKPKLGGRPFAHLLRSVAEVDSNMRVRFTSPHPKDFPPDLLDIINSHSNVCKQVHLPAQSGDNKILEAMGRGHTREAYLDLAAEIREKIPRVAITSDFICGFCGETETAHQNTLDLVKSMRYSFIYAFAYSMREKTRAHRRLIDDVSLDVKRQRVRDVMHAFQSTAFYDNQQQIGSKQLILIEQVSKRSAEDLRGRNDAGLAVIVDARTSLKSTNDADERPPLIGDFVVAEITSATSHSMRATPLYRTNLKEFVHSR